MSHSGLTKDRIIKSKHWFLDSWNDLDFDKLVEVLKPNKAGLTKDLVETISLLLSSSYKDWSIVDRYLYLKEAGSSRTIDTFQIRYGEINGKKLFEKKEKLKKERSTAASRLKNDRNNKILPLISKTNKSILDHRYIKCEYCSDKQLIDIVALRTSKKNLKYTNQILFYLRNKSPINNNTIKRMNFLIHQLGENWFDKMELLNQLNSSSHDYFKLLYGDRWFWFKSFGNNPLDNESRRLGLFNISILGYREKVRKLLSKSIISDDRIKGMPFDKSRHSIMERIDILINSKPSSNEYRLAKYGDVIGQGKIDFAKKKKIQAGRLIRDKNRSVESILSTMNHIDIPHKNKIELIKSPIYQNRINYHSKKHINDLIFDISEHKQPMICDLENYYSEKSFVKKSIIRYGKEKTEIILNDRAKKETSEQRKTPGCSGKIASKESLNLFLPIVKRVLDINPDCWIYIADKPRREYRISKYHEEKYHTFFYDLTFPKQKLIFEYNGSTWHPHPDYHDFSSWNHPSLEFSPEEKYQYDRFKILTAEQQGLKVIELWDFKGLKENTEMIEKHLKEVCLL